MFFISLNKSFWLLWVSHYLKLAISKQWFPFTQVLPPHQGCKQVTRFHFQWPLLRGVACAHARSDKSPLCLRIPLNKNRVYLQVDALKNAKAHHGSNISKERDSPKSQRLSSGHQDSTRLPKENAVFRGTLCCSKAACLGRCLVECAGKTFTTWESGGLKTRSHLLLTDSLRITEKLPSLALRPVGFCSTVWLVSFRGGSRTSCTQRITRARVAWHEKSSPPLDSILHWWRLNGPPSEMLSPSPCPPRRCKPMKIHWQPVYHC